MPSPVRRARRRGCCLLRQDPLRSLTLLDAVGRQVTRRGRTFGVRRDESSMNCPTKGPSPKSQGIVPVNDHEPLASVLAKSGMSVLPVNGLLISTCSVIELFGWKPAPTADATQPGQSPETPTVSEGTRRTRRSRRHVDSR